MLPILFVTMLFALTCTTAQADSHEPVRNLVSLSTSAQEEVDNDLLVIRLFIEQEGREQAAAADRVNQAMAWALEAAGKVATVKAQTLDYQTYPVHDEQQIVGWRVRQSLRLESADKAALTTLLGTLQEKLAIESLGYEVSREVREVVEARLIEVAINRFSARAASIAKAFGRASYTIVSVNIDAHGNQPQPIPYASAMREMKADVASPSIETGRQSLEVGISGTVELAQP